jgi:cytochrome c-type biogenesis protein CcmH/NrfF
LKVVALDLLFQSQKGKNNESKEPNEVEQKVMNYERVIKEIKKQLHCYKSEMASIKKSETYITMENY